MNTLRRKLIRELADAIESAKSGLENLKDEEAEYRDNMPENMQGSDRYEKADNAVSVMESAMDSLDEALASLEEAVE